MIPRVAALACVTALLLLLSSVGLEGRQSIVAGVASGVVADTPVPGSTQQGTLLQGSFPSDALGIAPPFRVYLPPGYNTSAQRFPVLYLLHGNAPDSDFAEWSDHMKIDFTAGSMIAQQQIAPMIIVMPWGQHSYFMNYPGSLPWADYITQDLVPYVDANYRTIADREHRAVGGNSMGATGALHFAFNHPDLFSIVGAHSPSLRIPPDDVIADANAYAPYDPLRLAETAPNLQTLQIWLDIGNQDPWRGNANGLHDRLVTRGIPHTWNMFPGMHDPSYWIAHSADYLRFYSNAFEHPISAPTPTPVATAPPTPQPTVTGAPAATPAPQPAAQAVGEFKLGFKLLTDQIPNMVGVPLENEHWGANGDSLQETSDGLMAWRKADNWTAFTDGSRTWINGPFGVQDRQNEQRFSWEAQ